jgi:type I restriction enzyme S subunit
MSSDDWRETTLGQFVRLQRGHDLTAEDRRPGSIPVMGSAGPTGLHDHAKAAGPGVVIGRSGVGSMGVVSYCSTDYWPHNTVLYVTDFLGNDERFVYYFLKHLNLRRFNSGSAQASLNRNFIYPLIIRVPPVGEQRRISGILSVLDDKIELNRRMNRTLESIARAIFKSWFVDFDPVRKKMEGKTGGELGLPPHLAALFPDSLEESPVGLIPRGWQTKPLDQIAEFLNGLALQKYPPTGTDDLPVIKGAELTRGINSSTSMASRGIPDEYRVQDGDLLFSWSGSLHCVIWTGGEGALNQHLFKVTPLACPRWFIYQWIHEHLAGFREIAADKATTMGHIKRGHLAEAVAVLAPRAVMAAADGMLAQLLERQLAAQTESRQLACLRDSLLPRLLDGTFALSVGSVAVTGAS